MRSRLLLNRCCCEEACVVYAPCCIRDVRVSLFVEVTKGGVNDYAFTKRFTLTNECNDQESPDWSTWERVGNVAGGETITHGGRTNQGCTFSIDIPHEHVFCSCGAKNFTAKLTLCNPHGADILVTATLPSMSIGFSNALNEIPCPLPLVSGSYSPVTLTPGEEHTFEMEFGALNWKTCFPNCVRGHSAVVLEDDTYLDDQFETTCLLPVLCAASDVDYETPSALQPSLLDCIGTYCPPCGCILEQEEPTPGPPTFVSYSEASGEDEVTIALPAGATLYDILLLAINGEGEDANADLSPPGWTAINAPADGTVTSGTDGNPDRTRLTLYWTRYNPQTPPSLAIPDAGTYTHAVITCWRNCVLSKSPIHAVQSSLDSTNDTSVTVAGLNTTVDDCLIVAITTAGDNITTGTWMNAHLLNVQQRVNSSTALGSGGHIGIASGHDDFAGTVPDFTATASASEQEANWMVALRRKETTWNDGDGCACGCGEYEAKRACEYPKEQLLSATALGGEFGMCESFDNGFKGLGYVAIFIGPNCEFYGGIFRNDAFSPSRLEYELMGVYDPPGPVGPLVELRQVSVEVEIDCQFFQVEWQWTGTDLELLINGSGATATPSFWTPLGNGTVYLVAQTGSVWTVQR